MYTTVDSNGGLKNASGRSFLSASNHQVCLSSGARSDREAIGWLLHYTSPLLIGRALINGSFPTIFLKTPQIEDVLEVIFKLFSFIAVRITQLTQTDDYQVLLVNPYLFLLGLKQLLE